MKIGDIEKERALFSIVKRARTEHIEPSAIRNIRNRIVFKRITDIYGKDMLSDLYMELIKSGVIEYRDGFYRLTDRGRRILKRGYVHIKVSKFASPEYSFYISVLALIVSLLNGEFLWKAVRFINQTSQTILRWLQTN